MAEWITIFPVSVGLLNCPDEKMSDGCVCMHERATRARCLHGSAGQSCPGLLWKIIAPPYTPATSMVRTAKGTAKGNFSPPTEVRHIMFLQLFWPQFGWLWVFDACNALTQVWNYQCPYQLWWIGHELPSGLSLQVSILRHGAEGCPSIVCEPATIGWQYLR